MYIKPCMLQLFYFVIQEKFYVYFYNVNYFFNYIKNSFDISPSEIWIFCENSDVKSIWIKWLGIIAINSRHAWYWNSYSKSTKKIKINIFQNAITIITV